jgi:hypothetical protein
MLLKYYDKAYEPWDIADYFGLGPDDAPSHGPFGAQINEFLDNVVRATYIWEFKMGTADLEAFLRSKLSAGHPVMIASGTVNHAFVVTGYDDNGVYISDPSGDCLTYLGRDFDRLALVSFPVPWSDFLGMVDNSFFTNYHRWSLNDSSLLPSSKSQTISVRCDDPHYGPKSFLAFSHGADPGLVWSELMWDGSGSHPGYYYKSEMGQRLTNGTLGDVMVEEDVVSLTVNISNSSQSPANCEATVWIENEGGSVVRGPITSLFEVDALKSNVVVPLLGQDISGFFPHVVDDIETGAEGVDDDQDGLVDENITPHVWTLEGLAPGKYSLCLQLRTEGVVVDSVSIDFLVAPASLTAIYRFWSPVHSRHFYTISESEKNKLINNYSNVWTYEGPAYSAFAAGSQPGVAPIYRFWSGTLNAHFYTMSQSERDKLINNYSHIWTFEGTAFYAYAAGSQPTGTSTVYRFWSGSLGCHFFTIREAEKDKLINLFPHVWTYERIAWYAYAV